MNLREAITKLQNCDLSKLTFGQVAALSLVLAAARAFACETCGGNGLGIQWDYGKDAFFDCPDCREDREKARGA